MLDLFKKMTGDKVQSEEGDSSMFAGFLECFGEKPIEISDEKDPYNAFIDHFEGRSFGGGVFKVVERADIPKWKEDILGLCLRRSEDGFRLFGYNWLGQFFAIDDQEGKGHVIIIDTDTTAYTDMGFLEYLNDELPENPERSLHVTQYGEWVASHGPVDPGECVGYKVPLFLGGDDSPDNMEVIDMDVYWTMTGQLWRAYLGLPEGTKIGNVSFE